MARQTETFERKWNPKQSAFIATSKRYAAYVGTMGCGKTSAFCRRAIAIATKYPDSRGILARYTYPELNNTLVPQFFEILPQGLIRKWRRSEGVLELRSGPTLEGTSTILFRNLEDPRKYRCNPGEAPILMADWSYKPINQIVVGDHIIGFDIGNQGQTRRPTTATILAVAKLRAPIVKVQLTSGEIIRCTADHRWFKALYSPSMDQDPYYRRTRVGLVLARVSKLITPLTEEQNELALWLGGIFDGEGNVRRDVDGTTLSLFQNRKTNPEVCDRIELALAMLGFSWSKSDSDEGTKYLITDGIAGIHRFLLLCRPAKAGRLREVLDGRGKLALSKEEIVSVTPDGEEDVYALETTTGNYVVWGYASKNSENLNFFGISQADDDGITEEHWQELTKRLRRQSGRWGPLPRQYAFLEANYRGHNWYWQLFTQEGQEASGRRKIPGFDPTDYVLVEGSTLDNIENLPEDYIADMEAMPEEWKRRHYYGSWEEAGGLVYNLLPTHLSPGVLVNGQFTREIPEYWHRYRTIDHGTRNPTVCLWATISPTGTVYIYDEYYQPGPLAMDHAKEIRKRRTMRDHKTGELIPLERFQYSLIDPSAFNKEGTSGESPAQQYYEVGVPVVKAPVAESLRDVGSGIAVVQKYLNVLDPTTGRPKLQILSGMAPNLIREFKEYVWDELSTLRRSRRNEPERPRKINDHALDALRYLLVSRPTASPDRTPKQVTTWARGMKEEEMFQATWEI